MYTTTNNNEVSATPMQPNIIELRLDLAEINIVIKALSERPFREVYELIGKIHTQSNVQLKQKELSNLCQ